ncbi:MAG: ribose-5-phosphate isomerase RpiA [Ferruginibacter sp.]
MAKDIEKEKQLAAKEAVKLISNNQVVGLGTGSTAVYAVMEIGKLVKEGLTIKGVPTSKKTRDLALSLNIPLLDINSVSSIDITIDGADEFNEDLILIKGGGGALFTEKIVALLTKQEIIIADSSKKVDVLGKFKLPVEVVPIAFNYVLTKLKAIGGTGKIRLVADKPFITDQGNYIVDVDFGAITAPAPLAQALKEIEGIVGHGLFIDLTAKIIMGSDDSTITYLAKQS